jgi:hypothetical protein
MHPLDIICIVGSIIACGAYCINLKREKVRRPGKIYEPIAFDEPPRMMSRGFPINGPCRLEGRTIQTSGPDYLWLRQTMRDPAIPSVASEFSWTTEQWASPRPPPSTGFHATQ